jgi:hypothetical protein
MFMKNTKDEDRETRCQTHLPAELVLPATIAFALVISCSTTAILCADTETCDENKKN